MNRKKVCMIIIVIIICIFILLIFIGLYQYLRIKSAKIEVTLVDNLVLEFNDKKKVSDFIDSINGTIVNDYTIDSTKLGKKDVEFQFINDDKIKVKYTYQINVVDTTAPLIWLSNNYYVEKGTDIDLTKKILCGDNYDNNPNCYIDGKYDLNVAKDYELTFKAIDSSGNEEKQPFTLTVYEPEVDTKSNLNNVKKTNTDFKDVVKKYKTDKTKIGIDVSSWQGDINFEKIKKAGVEFIIIRVGSHSGTKEKYFLDSKFKRNISEANRYDIDVGIYFYSYANSIKDAKEDARWVLKQIKDYNVTLPIAFDWEEWGNFNEYNLSFFGLTSMAEAFLEEIEKEGYQGMLYSSKIYLDYIWFPTKYDIWLAHYTDQTSYKGKYKFWQICNNGKVDGINSDVDINIMY